MLGEGKWLPVQKDGECKLTVCIGMGIMVFGLMITSNMAFQAHVLPLATNRLAKRERSLKCWVLSFGILARDVLAERWQDKNIHKHDSLDVGMVFRV